MKFQKQLIEHNLADGMVGDCFRTCIAVLLDMDAVDVPHFYEDSYLDPKDDKWDQAAAIDQWVSNWLAERGVSIIRIGYNTDTPLEDMLIYIGRCTNMPYMLSGNSRSGNAHVVICQGDKIIWDTHPKDVGLVGPMEGDLWLVEWLVRPLESQP